MDDEDAIEALYHEVVDLGDRAREWFDGAGLAWREDLPADANAAVAVESLGTTARLLAVMAWLLDPLQAGGIRPPFTFDVPAPDLPAGSPLAGTKGGEIARASRRLVAAARAIADGENADGERA